MFADAMARATARWRRLLLKWLWGQAWTVLGPILNLAKHYDRLLGKCRPREKKFKEKKVKIPKELLSQET